MSEPIGTPRIVIAGVTSNAGTTTVALGIVAALRQRGRAVQTERDFAYVIHNCDSQALGCEGWGRADLFVSLVHLHFGQDRGIAPRFVNAVREAASKRHLAAV